MALKRERSNDEQHEEAVQVEQHCPEHTQQSRPPEALDTESKKNTCPEHAQQSRPPEALDAESKNSTALNMHSNPGRQ